MSTSPAVNAIALSPAELTIVSRQIPSSATGATARNRSADTRGANWCFVWIAAEISTGPSQSTITAKPTTRKIACLGEAALRPIRRRKPWVCRRINVSRAGFIQRLDLRCRDRRLNLGGTEEQLLQRRVLVQPRKGHSGLFDPSEEEPLAVMDDQQVCAEIFDQ